MGRHLWRTYDAFVYICNKFVSETCRKDLANHWVQAAFLLAGSQGRVNGPRPARSSLQALEIQRGSGGDGEPNDMALIRVCVLRVALTVSPPCRLQGSHSSAASLEILVAIGDLYPLYDVLLDVRRINQPSR